MNIVNTNTLQPKQCLGTSTMTKMVDITVRQQRLSMIWCIENFTCTIDSNKKIQSEQFYSGENKEYVWRLDLYPRRYFGNKRDVVGLILCLTSKNLRNNLLTYQLTISVRNSEDIVLKDYQELRPLYHGYSQFGTYHLISGNKLYEEGLLKNNLLKLCCEFVLYDDLSPIPCPLPVEVKKQPKTKKGIATLLENSKYSDAMIKVDDISIPVHKAVLGTYSETFDTIFAVSDNNVIEIDEYNADTIKALLQFIYTGETDVNDSKTIGYLLHAANNYEIKELELWCEDWFSGTIKERNVIDILILADKEHATRLKANALSFIASHASSVVDELECDKLLESGPHLLSEVSILLAKRVTTNCT